MPKAFTMKKSYLVVFLVSSLVGNAVLLVMLMRSSCFPTLPLHSSTTSARTLKTDGVAGAAQHDKPFQPPSFAYPHPPQPKQYDMFHEIASYVRLHGQRALKPSFIIPPMEREHLGRLLEAMGSFHVGVELGVQEGIFAKALLNSWPSCHRFYLVDVWAHQANYQDHANAGDEVREQELKTAQHLLKEHAAKTVFVRNLTVQAAKIVPDQLDFVYVDARHDYCGVWEDITTWWEKLRVGGIMAGHDYHDAALVWPGQDWELCQNGTRHPGAVMGAVNDFALRNSLPVAVTYTGITRSWMMRKPLPRKPATFSKRPPLV